MLGRGNALLMVEDGLQGATFWICQFKQFRSVPRHAIATKRRYGGNLQSPVCSSLPSFLLANHPFFFLSIMTKEEDDLYADLYNDDLGPVGDTSGGDGVDDSIYGEDVKPKGMSIQGSANAASSGKSSFIPAAKPTQSTGSSFIPNDSSRAGGGDAAGGSSAGRSFIPSTTTTTTTAIPVANTSRIETAPMTNTDTSSKVMSSYSGGDQSYKQVQPHEMPDEG